MGGPAAKLQTDVMEFNLLEVLDRVLRGWRLIVGLALLGLLTGIAISLVEKPWFFSQAVFLPPHYTDLSTASPAAALLGGGSGESSDVYLGLLVSRTVQDDVIDHLGLMSIYKARSRTEARRLLQASSFFGVNRNALIFINVRSDDRKLAADIANTYLDALYRLNGQMISSSSDHRRVFFQQQLEEQKNELREAELALKETEERTGFVQPNVETAAGIGAEAGLQAQINGAEERLAGLLIGETDQNPEVVQARAQLAQLRAQLQRQAGSNVDSPGIPSARRIPGLTLEVEQKQRDLSRTETAYEQLLQQYARARLAATDPGPQMEVIDRAVPSEFKAGPNRRQLVELSTAIGFFVGLLYLLFFAPVRNAWTFLRRRMTAAQAS